MSTELPKTSSRWLWLALLAGVLLWAQISNLQHIHHENHVPHECMNCSQSKSVDGIPSANFVFDMGPPEAVYAVDYPTDTLRVISRTFSIRAPPSI